MEKHKRKPNRLENYDYSQNNAYFLTLCSKRKQNLFWDEEKLTHPFELEFLPLSNVGTIIEETIRKIPVVYPSVEIDTCVIMPNHIHIILRLSDDLGRAMRAPTISAVINQFKGVVTKQVGYPVWQKSFYDHIIRNEEEYQLIWDYIDLNPVNWIDDTKYGS